MKISSLSFLGNFEDAFLYMGRLIIITENQSVRVYDMKKIVDKLQESTAFMDVPRLLFLRNDEIDNFSKNYNHDDKENFLDAIGRFAVEHHQIDLNFTDFSEWDLNIDADIILDLNIYNGRLYIGTNKGLYHLDLDWDSEETRPIHEPQKRLDAKCVQTTAKFGTVNASCCSDGLFSFLDDFDLGTNNFPKEKHTPESSLRTAWLDSNFINYSTTICFELFNGIKTKLSKESLTSLLSSKILEQEIEKEEWILTDLREIDEFKLNNLIEDLNRNRFNTIDLESIQFVFNSNKNLFISTYDGRLFTVILDENHSSIPIVSYSQPYEGLTSLVSSIHTLGVKRAGLVIETDDNVLLFANREFMTVFPDEVISIRTFSRSKHYKNIISLTTSNEVRLISVFDDQI